MIEHTHYNDTITNNTTVNNLFEGKLDICGVEFSNISTHPHVKEIIQIVFNKLSQEVTSVKKNFKIENNFELKWSSVIAGRQQSEQKLPSMILTIITSQASSVMVASTKKHMAAKKTKNKQTKKNLWNKQRRNLLLYSLVIAMRENMLVYLNIN